MIIIIMIIIIIIFYPREFSTEGLKIITINRFA